MTDLWSTANFIHRAKDCHGSKYNYDNVNYINETTLVIINCPLHGNFDQRPSNHVRGSGCPECGKIRTREGLHRSNKQRTLTTEEFISRANEVHSSKYNYDKVDYKSYMSKVEIMCSTHGSFLQAPGKHLSGTGCPKCANKKVTTEEFISKCKKVHGDKYDYSRVAYKPGYTKVEIICPNHGSFFQVTYNHLSNKQGCPECKLEKLKNNIGYYNEQLFESSPNLKSLPAKFYIVKCTGNNESFYKVGITRQQKVENRFVGFPYSIELLEVIPCTLYEAFQQEQKILKVEKRYTPKLKFNGWTECLENISE